MRRCPTATEDPRGDRCVRAVPCKREFPFLHRKAMGLVANHSATRVTTATLFINGNFESARRLLPRLLLARGARVHLVTSAEGDARRFANCTGVRPVRVLRAAARDAFPQSFDALRDEWRALRNGDVVLLAAGPLGRVLGVAWHKQQPRATYLELGSFFDPDLTSSTFVRAHALPRRLVLFRAARDVCLSRIARLSLGERTARSTARATIRSGSAASCATRARTWPRRGTRRAATRTTCAPASTSELFGRCRRTPYRDRGRK